MKNEVILRKGKYALIDRGHEYVVAHGFNGINKEWVHGSYYSYWNEGSDKKMSCLQAALDHFRMLTDKDYISRRRLEELATLFKDGLIEDDRENAMEYFNEVCELEESEKEFFGIDENSPIANTKFENPMYNKGYDDGFSDAMNDKED